MKSKTMKQEREACLLDKVLVCFALEHEAAPFRRAIKNQARVSILITGIGQQNARNSLRKALTDNSPTLVLTCGFAGGLDPRLKIGDVVFMTIEPGLDRALEEAGARPVGFHCVTRIVSSAAEKAALRSKTNMPAVEMESGVIQEVCREHNVPAGTVRAISDAAMDDLPLDFNKLSNPDQSLNYGKLAWAVAKSPGKIPALLRLQKNSRLAAENLARVLVKVIGAP